jgi:hypothetical protein
MKLHYVQYLVRVLLYCTWYADGVTELWYCTWYAYILRFYDILYDTVYLRIIQYVVAI